MEINHINNYNNIKFNSDEVINISPKKNNEYIKKHKKIHDDFFFDEIQQKNKNIIKNENIIKNDNDINENYKELKQEFNNFLENVLLGTTKIKNIIKKIDKQIQKNDIIKDKINIKKTSLNKDKGFAENKSVPKSIRIFFNLEETIKMPRTKVGGLFQEYLKKNNLKGHMNEKNKIDKRIYIFDDKLAKLFNITNEQKNKINSCISSKVEYPNGYNFYNYQTWIKKLYDEDDKQDNKNNKENNQCNNDILYSKII